MNGNNDTNVGYTQDINIVGALEPTVDQLAAIEALRREAEALRDLHWTLWLLVGKALLDGAGAHNFDYLMDGIADAMHT